MANDSLRGGAAALLGLIAAALSAPWLSGADPLVQYDPVRGANLPPGTSRYEIVQLDGSRQLGRSVTIAGEELIVVTDSETRAIPLDLIRPSQRGEPARQRLFPLGTDRLGRDIWSRLLHGSRVSLLVALAAALLAGALGTVAGGVAAAAGGAVDGFLMRLTDAFMAFPRLFLLLALAAFLEAGPGTVVLVLGLTSWMPVARLARAEILRLEAGEMALAARAAGATRLRALWAHLLPNALAPLVVATTLRIGDVLLLEAALSFLGLGIRPPLPSWGNMIGDGAANIATAWWQTTLPGLAIVVTVVAFNLIGDGLRLRLQCQPTTPPP